MEEQAEEPTREEFEVKLSKGRKLVGVGELGEASSLLSGILRDFADVKHLENLKVDTLAELGKCMWKKGAYDEAGKLLDEAIELGASLSYDIGRSYALNYRGNVELSRGNLARAKSLYLESLEIRKRIEDLEGVAVSLLNIGVTLAEGGELESAADYFKQSIELNKERDTLMAKLTLATALNNLAGCYRNQGDIEKAKPLYFECLDLAKKIGGKDKEALCLLSLGILAFAQGDLVTAQKRLTKSQSLWQSLGFAHRKYVKSIATLAGVFTELSEFNKAEALLADAQKIAEATKSDFAKLYVLYYNGFLEMKKGNVASARKLFESCLAKARIINSFEFTLKSLVDLALINCFEFRLTLDENKISETQELIEEICDSAIERQVISAQVEAEIIQGMLLSATMDYESALNTLSEALKHSKERKLPRQAKMANEQIKKVQRLKERARKLIRQPTQKEQVEEIRSYLDKYQQVLKAFKS